MAGLKPQATEIILRARDGYTDSIPLKKGLDPGTILAYEMNGAVLPHPHGFPSRVIVPGIYGMKNVKWLTEIELADFDYKGYWEKKGWSDEAVYKTMSRIDVPRDKIVEAGEVNLIAGIAFAGDRGVRSVEVSVDSGKSWRQATVKPPLSRYTWVLWALEWEVSESLRGRTATLQVRATDGRGEIQIARAQSPSPDGASGYHTVTVRIR